MTSSASAELERLASRVRLGLSDWREVERVGLDLLGKGHSDPDIVRLASVTHASEHVSTMVEAAVNAAGGQVPDDEEAARMASRELAAAIAGGTITPIAGARELWRVARQVPAVEPELRVFIGLASEWDDDDLNRTAYEEDIAVAARAYINLARDDEL